MTGIPPAARGVP